jgi:hypothetical protein
MAATCWVTRDAERVRGNRRGRIKKRTRKGWETGEGGEGREQKKG